ncbi:MAG: hydantoinase/oxoprolinase family protein [Acidobacteria bacterium]|nr:hydantoinase/oxoprolinase family protein [Acidobacteriota bacterium]
MRIGVDTGGTFTDCVIFEGGEIRILKVFSTPQNPARGIVDGVFRALPGGAPRGLEIIHGTTIGTNSLLERRGARVALVTTAGFEDLIEIGRQNRPRLYDFNVRREPPLVPRSLRFGVGERTAASGEILQSPTSAEIKSLKDRILGARAESVALCFLFSFSNPTNERRVARALRKLGIPVSVSHEILPEFREYERLSTIATNAFLAPRMGKYLKSLVHIVGERSALPRDVKIQSRGLPHPRPPCVYVMQSSGGITTAERAAREPVRTILSGPAGGVVAAAWLAHQTGMERAISFDMGGTSTDVCLIEGAPRLTNETTLGGLSVAVPVLDVHSVGAGGGSIARIDAGGALRVGPESAGSVPGPACYDRGGKLPTVTDAHVLLGRLDPECFLGGSYPLNAAAAERAFRKFLNGSGSAFKSPLDLARGIVAVANANMDRALRVISVESGHDPREFSLVSFGGAGGLHAADLARALGLGSVIVPQNPGAFSALGILISDVVKDASLSVLRTVPNGSLDAKRGFQSLLRALESDLGRLEAAARKQLRSEQSNAGRTAVSRFLDLRYRGQAYELTVPFAPDFLARFHREHEKTYGYAHRGRAVEIVNLRLRLTMPTPKPSVRRLGSGVRRKLSEAIAGIKPVWFESRLWETPTYSRVKLSAGMRFQGPAIIGEYSSTTVLPPDFVCEVDKQGNLILQRAGK